MKTNLISEKSRGSVTISTSNFVLDETRKRHYNYHLKKIILCQSNVRRHIIRKQYIALKSKFDRRKEIMKELLDSELTYVLYLRSIVENFMNPIRSGFNSSNVKGKSSSSLSKNSSASTSSPNLINAKSISSQSSSLMNESSFKTIFGDIEVLMFYNGVFRDTLVKTSKDYQKSWIFPNSTLGNIFLSMLDMLQAYVKYVRNIKGTLILLKGISEERKAFSDFLVERKKSMEQDLEELLWLPVIRINQYIIIVNELLSYATWNEEDSKKLWIVKDKLFSVLLSRLDSVGTLHFLSSSSTHSINQINGTASSGGTFTSTSSSSSSIMQYINFRYEYSDDIVDILCKIHEVEKQRIHNKLSGTAIPLSGEGQEINRILRTAFVGVPYYDIHKKRETIDKLMHIVSSLQYFPLSFNSQVTQSSSLNPAVARSTSPSPSNHHVGSSGSSSVGRRGTISRERSSSLFHKEASSSSSNANVSSSTSSGSSGSSSSNTISNFPSLNFVNSNSISVSIPSQDSLSSDSNKTSHCLSLVTLDKVFRLVKSLHLQNRREIYVIKCQSVIRCYIAKSNYKRILKKYGGYTTLIHRNSSFRQLILTVLETHEKLLEELERIYKNWPEIEDVGESLLPLVDSIHAAYGPYVRGFRRAIDTLTRVKADNPKLAHAILDIQHRILTTSSSSLLPSTLSTSSLSPNSSANTAITLNNLLTYPLTRISQYELLIDHITRNTPLVLKDFKYLTDLTNQLLSLNKSIEESAQQSTVYAAIYDLKRRVEAPDPKIMESFVLESLGDCEKVRRLSDEPSSVKIRQLLREGIVSIKENEGKLKEKRYIFLFNDCFLLTKVRQTNSHSFSKSNNFKYKTCVRLDSFPSPSLAEDFVSSGKTGIKVIIPPGNYILIFKTILEKENWMNEFRGVLLNLHMKRSGFFFLFFSYEFAAKKHTNSLVLSAKDEEKLKAKFNSRDPMRNRAKSPPPSIKRKEDKRDSFTKPEKPNIPVPAPSSPVVSNLIQEDSSSRSRSQGQKDLKIMFDQFVPPARNSKNNSEPASKAPSTNSTVSSSSSSIPSLNSIPSPSSTVVSPSSSSSTQKRLPSPLLPNFYQPDPKPPSIPPLPYSLSSASLISPNSNNNTNNNSNNTNNTSSNNASTSSSTLLTNSNSNSTPSPSSSSVVQVSSSIPNVPNSNPPSIPNSNPPSAPIAVSSPPTKVSSPDQQADSPKPPLSMKAAMMKSKEKKKDPSKDPQRKYRTAPTKHMKKEDDPDQADPDPVLLTPKATRSPLAETTSTSTDSVLNIYQKDEIKQLPSLGDKSRSGTNVDLLANFKDDQVYLATLRALIDESGN